MTKQSTPAKYTTRAGDTVDYICWKYYGTERGGTTEAVLAANFGLSEYGAVLPAGIQLVLPPLTLPASSEKLIELWD